MNLSSKLLLGFCFFALISCEKSIKTYNPKTPNLQVINSFQCTDSVAQCYITKLNDINSVNINYVTNAQVYLYDNNNALIDTLSQMQTGYYKGKVTLTNYNITYKLQSTVSGMQTAYCEFQLPKKNTFEVSSLKYNLFYVDANSFINPKIESKIIINDSPSEDFYQLEIYQIDSVLNTSLTYEYQYNLILNNGTNNALINQDYDTANNGDAYQNMFFSDKTFNGTSFSFNFYTGVSTNTSSQNYNNKTPKLMLVILKSLSKPLFDYFKTLKSQVLAQGNSGNGLSYLYNLYPFAPVNSNITNGVGVFSCYSLSMQKVIVTP